MRRRVRVRVRVRVRPWWRLPRAARGSSASRSDAGQLGQPGALGRWGAEQELRRLRSSEVQVRIVFPGVSEAAVDLDALLRGPGEGLRAVDVGERGGERRVRLVVGDGRAGVLRRRPGALDLKQHRGALVLDRLERADRAAELLAD